MKLILHSDGAENQLSEHYRRAFANSTELYIVSAYLTDWNTSLKLNEDCKSFRIIIGKDFGITRKAACQALMGWLPAKRKAAFLVADQIGGYHPKAVFWKEADGSAHAVVGSSNLTDAAFTTNYEANVYGRISAAEFKAAKKWVARIEDLAVVVSPDWLETYQEAQPSGVGRGGRKKSKSGGPDGPIVDLWLPRPSGMQRTLEVRRAQMASYAKHREGITDLFERCASGAITSARFYEELPKHWDGKLGDRLQGDGWARQGKRANFRQLAKSFLKIVAASKSERDDVVREQIDYLHDQKNSARTSFLSEMLCLRFPKDYPVVNDPVKAYLKRIKFRAPRGASEGARYIDLAKKLRASLQQNPDHPAKNIAELDTVIWLRFKKKKNARVKATQ